MAKSFCKIEIVFPVNVEAPLGFFHVLDSLIDMICKQYEHEHPTRVMWTAGHGSKPIWREPEEPDFDDSIYEISVSEREAYPKELERRNQCCTKENKKQ